MKMHHEHSKEMQIEKRRNASNNLYGSQLCCKNDVALQYDVCLLIVQI